VRLRNHDEGYGAVTKSLHWLTVIAIATQFTVGYAMDVGGQGRGRGRGRGGDSGRGRGRGGDDVSLGFDPGDDALLTTHVILGVTILTLALLRLLWRRATPLPPWAPGLSAGERQLATWTERALYLCLILMPATGLSLILVSDDLLAVHVTSHIVFFAALATHLGLVLKHQLIDRDRLLRRMI
jgi:cytochrome b561